LSCFFFSWKHLAFYVRRIFIFTDTKQKLKSIREYDDIYIYGAFVIVFLGVISIFVTISYVDFVPIFWYSWNAFTSLISALEKGEMNYTCSFGISFQTVKCEVFGAVNRALFYLMVQFFKWLQDSFSPSAGFNIFKILSSISFFYYAIMSLFYFEFFYVVLRRGFNNFVLFFYATVYSLHAIHNWREIVMNVPDDQPSVVNVNDEAEDAHDGAHALPADIPVAKSYLPLTNGRRSGRNSGGGNATM